MLVISTDDDLADHSPLEFLSMTTIDTCRVLNLLGDYRYLRLGYYVSLHAELIKLSVLPTIKDILDIYRPPLFLTRAKKAGFSTIPFTLVTETPHNIEMPCVILAINPFTVNSIRIAKSKSSLIHNITELSYAGRYAVCLQPLLGTLHQVEMVLGHTKEPEFALEAKQVFKEFQIPMGKLVIQQAKDANYLCHILPTAVNGRNSQEISDILAIWRMEGLNE